jgi:hypothetical protein
VIVRHLYYPDERYVKVYHPSVTVVLGLRIASELPEVPPTLPGRIVGVTGPTDKTLIGSPPPHFTGVPLKRRKRSCGSGRTANAEAGQYSALGARALSRGITAPAVVPI